MVDLQARADRLRDDRRTPAPQVNHLAMPCITPLDQPLNPDNSFIIKILMGCHAQRAAEARWRPVNGFKTLHPVS